MTGIEKALAEGRRALNEYESKQLLADYGFEVAREMTVASAAEAAQAGETLGFPVVIKGYGADLMHKTDAGAVFLHVNDAASARAAYEDMEKRLGERLEGAVVAGMVPGRREVAMGLHREPGFGPCVMIGVGGVMTEIINDTAFRVAPLDDAEARDMALDLRAKDLFGPFRGEAAVDMDAVSRCLSAIGEIGLAHPEISEIDINPLIITPEGCLVAVDALVVLKGGAS